MGTLLIVQIVQEGFGVLKQIPYVPEEFARHLLQTAVPMALVGREFKALFQMFAGKGFVLLIGRCLATMATVLHITGGDPIFDLCVALRNKINIDGGAFMKLELPALYFQLLFMPNVVMHARMEAGIEYEIFDIHFEPDFLDALKTGYKSVDHFINQVQKGNPVNLNPVARRCPTLMLEAVQGIIHNNYSPIGKIRLLQNNVENILTAAVEDSEKEIVLTPELSETQVTALHEVKRLIDASIPYYPGNKELCRKTYLNHFTFNDGFKRLFGTSPYKYYTSQRMEKGKELLRRGESVHSVAAELDFESPRAFGKAFKLAFGITPSEYRSGFSPA